MILLVQTYGVSFEIPAILETFGIPYKVAWVVGDGKLHAPEGAFALGSMDCRNYLRRYKAVFVNNFQDANNTWRGMNPTLDVWLNWTASSDPPFVHFGAAISVLRGLNLPQQFPIVLADPSRVESTMWRWEEQVGTRVQVPASRIGTRIYLTREQRTVYVRAFNLRWRVGAGIECASYLINLSQLLALGEAGEVLAVPDFPDQSRLPGVPEGLLPAFAVRYYNHYFLPWVSFYTSRMGSYSLWRSAGFAFWIIYALKLTGIKPMSLVPVVHEFDHWIVTVANQPQNPRRVDQVRILLDTYAWLRDFGRMRGICIPFGNRAGGRYQPYSGDWDALYRTNMYDAGDGAVGQSLARAILDVLLSAPEVFSLGIHDHSIPRVNHAGFNNSYGGIIQGCRRHTDAGWPLAAPQRVPIAHGTVYKRGHAPNIPNEPNGTTRFTFLKNQIEYLDINPATTTDRQFDIRDGTFYCAQLLIERDIAEAFQLGFNGRGYGHAYTNCAGNAHGGEGYWEAWIRSGFRGLRVDAGERQRPQPKDPRFWHYQELHFVTSYNIDLSRQMQPGIYHPQYPEYSGVGYWGLDLFGEIVTNWGTEYPLRGAIAVRRLLSTVVDIVLWYATVLRGTTYSHPIGVASCNRQNPLQPALDRADYTGNFNYILEYFQAIDEVVQVLDGYLYWGTITDVMNLRELRYK